MVCLFLGIGTALVYLTLLVAISDIAPPIWRAISLGIYRFWRDMGFVIGAVRIGFVDDLFNMFIAIQIVAYVGLVSGVVVIFLMKETKMLSFFYLLTCKNSLCIGILLHKGTEYPHTNEKCYQL